MKSDKLFWDWFKKRENDFFNLDPGKAEARELLFDEMSKQLVRIHPNLAFEFGPVSDSSREFIISADGNREAFPAVLRLVGSAPNLARWKVIAFRPRQTPIQSVTLNGITIRPEEVQFLLFSNGQMAGIQLFIPAISDRDTTRKLIGYILLDSALGEYDVETKVGYIKMLPPESMTNGDRFPLSQLPEMFDRLVATLPESDQSS